ncbi:hypothetical protein PF005_g24965 [Phytophthora fragariae]|uniref:Uncharacterized protein n=1 Tax=Phytophthora fragariae TaxID=53985 RepID=A0A6A3W4R9_9STRA|nr:hypothetical protein PF009_g24723 [Phytophthora fragariae]KAE9176421.1 hypothetical protein PF005_g24965 [Phytophthora fragariae]KAE9226026.1 hypothetical protein PF004_g11772 [Phytophthora fragariae]
MARGAVDGDIQAGREQVQVARRTETRIHLRRVLVRPSGRHEVDAMPVALHSSSICRPVQAAEAVEKGHCGCAQPQLATRPGSFGFRRSRLKSERRHKHQGQDAKCRRVELYPPTIPLWGCHSAPCSSSKFDQHHYTDADADAAAQPRRKFAVKDAQRVWARTAPTSIPASGRRQPHPHQCVSIAEGLDLSYHADMRLLRAGRYLHKHDDDLDCEQELDEDDPAFYGNLAFFRLQCGVQLRVVRRSAHPLKAPAAPASPSAVDDRDEDIFAMEL